MQIKILGSGCCRCKKTYDTVKKVIEQDKIDATVEYVTDIARILDYDIKALPAIVINGKVMLNGQVPDESQVRQIIQNQKDNQ
jgi:small redox-active disulfide protein 2